MVASSSICFLFLIVFVSILASAVPANDAGQSNRQAAASQQTPRGSRNADNPRRGRIDTTRRTTTTTTPAPVHHKHSSKCLIMELARFNNITAEFKDLIETGLPHNKTFQAELVLGRERYTNHGTSKKKADDKVSREAWSLTKYRKPNLKPKTCEIGEKSAINVVHEWANQNALTASFYVTKIEMGPPKVYVVQCDISNANLTTQANSTVKKQAKNEAAIKMMALLKESRWSNDPAIRYNLTERMTMHPMSRVNAIQAARGEDEVKCRLVNQVPSMDGEGKSVINFIYQCDAGNYKSTGIGRNAKQAKRDAANNLLRVMNFTVTT